MSHRILIADDEPNHRRCLSISLRLEGYEVFEAADGQQALDVLAEEQIDVLVCDLMMPRIDGLELSRRMRFAYPNTRIILMSAYHLTCAQLERAQAGDIRFLPKPYEFRQLEQHLAACLGTGAPNAQIAVAL
jgi:CheY-like chemotaxis protein